MSLEHVHLTLNVYSLQPFTKELFADVVTDKGELQKQAMFMVQDPATARCGRAQAPALNSRRPIMTSSEIALINVPR